MSSTISAGTTSGTAIAISGDTSGQLVLQTNGTTTAVTISTGQVVTLAQPLPVASGGSGVTTSTGTGAVVLGTSPTLATPVLSGSVTGTYTLAGTPTMGASLITAGTAVASTSGTSIDFTGIPSWVKRITVNLIGTSNSGGVTLFQLGISTGAVTSGYLGCGKNETQTTNYTTGIGIASTTGEVAASVMHGMAIFVLAVSSTNTWVGTFTGGRSNEAVMCFGAGTISLSAVLDRIRITTVAGTATFDAGSINILYE